MTVMTGGARVAGVVGWPIAHSRSPILHGTWLARHGVDGAYVPLAVPPEGARDALRALPLLGFAGVNVTVPHKETAFVIADRLTDRARRAGAVNTLVVEADGSLLGDNTDGFGFLENLRQEGPPGWDPAGRPAVVIGAGGAARAVCAALLDAGCPRLDLVNRTPERAQAVADHLGGPIRALGLEALPQALAEAGLLANATSLGMTGQPPLEGDLAPLPADALVTDLVYAPLETPLLADARARGNPVVDGLGMLLHQARPGFEAWFGVAPQVDAALRAAVLGTKAP